MHTTRFAVVAAAMALVSALPAPAHAQQCPSPQSSGARRLSAYFDAGRVLLAPASARGDTTYFILDSGGGFNAMAERRVTALGLESHLEGSGSDTGTVIPVAAFGDSMRLPVPIAGHPSRGLLAVTRELDDLGPMYAVPVAGFLGGGWWADRVWLVDYLHKELWLYPRSVLAPPAPGAPPAHQLPLFFRTARDGHRTTNFARFRALVDGDSISLLFDTGATTRLSDSALAIVHDGGPAGRAGSFVPSDIFDKWHTHHPEWRVIERGEMGRQAMIEVPSMEIAGYTIGPVWWERRVAADFHKLMDPLMDQPIQGSLGGAAFQYFAITVDYPKSMACVQR